MDLRSAVSTAVTVLLVLVAVLILATQVFGFPSPISYVSTDSMEPQLEPGDGFVGVPRPLAGEIEPGDVITFEAQAVGGGGLTTHRVVEETDAGYITKGDANPFRDTAAGEPPVTESQIQLVVVQINGEILVIPNVGDVANAAQGVIGGVIAAVGVSGVSGSNPGIIIAVFGLLLVVGGFGYDLVSADTVRTMNRSPSRDAMLDSRLVLAALLLIVVLPLLSVTAIPSGTDELSIVSTDRSYDDPSRIVAGTYTETNATIENSQPVPMVIIVEPASDGIEISDRVLSAASGETVKTEMRIWAPEETGGYVRSRSVHFYLNVLPADIISSLHRIHPVVALTATTGVILLPVVVLFLLVVGSRKIPLREVSR